MEEPMLRTTTRNSGKLHTLRLAASALAVTASLSGAGAYADHGGGYKSNGGHRHTTTVAPYRNAIRVHIPVRDHGPETLPLGKLIRQNSDLNLRDYRLVAVVTKNGRFSNGYASLRTGNHRSGRYFLGRRETTRIPAPGRADEKWHLRLGPGTQVRSVTAVLEPRWKARSHAYHEQWNGPAERHRSDAGYRNVQVGPLVGLAWLLAKTEDDEEEKRIRKLRKSNARTEIELARTEAELARTQAELERSRNRHKTIKSQRERLAEAQVHGSRSRSNADKQARSNKRTVRYVTSERYSGREKRS
jgi:hypothetical protein